MKTPLRSFALPAAACALVLALAVAGSCNTATTQLTSGDFIAPSGLAVTSAADRDLLFIASAGGNNLRVLMICNTPALADGGIDPANTCPALEDYQFLPAPIRVFPAALQVGERPVRLAGARLLAPDGGAAGAVIVGGADPKLQLIDAANVLDAEKSLAPLKAPQPTDLINSPPVDVIAINAYAPASPDIDVGSPSVRAYALTQSAASQPAHIVSLRVAFGANGPVMTKQGRCALLDPQTSAIVQATRLAAIPKSGVLPPSGNIADDAPYDNLLYVADGTPGGVPGGLGDGALELDTTQPALTLGSDPLDGNPAAAIATCTIRRRIPATSVYADDGSAVDGGIAMPLRSLALSPRYEVPAPAIVTPATDPDGGPATNPDGGPATNSDGGPATITTFQPSRPLPPASLLLGATTDGKIVFVRTDQPQGGLAPVPPYPYVPGSPNAGCIADKLADGGTGPCLAAPTPMEPLQINGGPTAPLAREVNFLKPPSRCDPTLALFGLGCTIIQPGIGGIFTSVPYRLAATVTATDGATYFLDADSRRFISDYRDGQSTTGNLPGFLTLPTFSPLQPNGQAAPSLFFNPPVLDPSGTQIAGATCCLASTTNLEFGGNLNAGVTASQTWRLVWHGILPGLERRGGTLSRKADGALHIDFPVGDPSQALTAWTRENILDVGDVFAVQLYSQAGTGVCAQLEQQNQQVFVNGTQSQPEFTITALSPWSLDAAPCTQCLPSLQLQIDQACLPAGATVGVTVEMRSGQGFANAPWLVFEGSRLRGRASAGTMFSARGRRFDYPLPYAVTDPRSGGVATTEFLPTPDKDVSVAFKIALPEPVTPFSFITFVLGSGQSATRVSDSAANGAFAGPSILYTSPKVTNLVFTSVTGANSLLQIDPSQLQVVNGVLVYR